MVRATADAIETEHARYPVEAIVFATGYDAVTGALSRIHIRGRGGEPLETKGAAGPKTYSGVISAGFPNLWASGGSAFRHVRRRASSRGRRR